jgi:hypothetical protein
MVVGGPDPGATVIDVAAAASNVKAKEKTTNRHKSIMNLIAFIFLTPPISFRNQLHGPL